MPAEPGNNPVTRRPAESGTAVAGAVVAVIVWIFGIKNPNVVAPLTIIVGFVPTAISWLVETIRGTKRSPSPTAP